MMLKCLIAVELAEKQSLDNVQTGRGLRQSIIVDGHGRQFASHALVAGKVRIGLLFALPRTSVLRKEQSPRATKLKSFQKSVYHSPI